MSKSWVESRKRYKAEQVARLTQSALDRQEAVKEEFRKKSFGPYITLSEGDSRHPTHTIADGRTMSKD